MQCRGCRSDAPLSSHPALQWWGATLLKRMEGNSDAAGRQLYKIK